VCERLLRDRGAFAEGAEDTGEVLHGLTVIPAEVGG
jgi:hypothetical protein